jgi:CubicO group peptidase (beta-lactamase class C family)
MNKMQRCLVHSVLLLALLALASCQKDAQPEEPLGDTSVGAPAKSLAEFEGVMERIRSELKIPGLSAAITKNRKIVWVKGFGDANRDAGRMATPESVYHLASLTKPFAATVIMRLVEEKKLDLEDPVAKYGVTLESQGIIRVKHLLSHTSEGMPGDSYHYSGNRFSYLDAVIPAVAGRTFCELLNERILLRLAMNLTGPNPSSPDGCLRSDPRNGQIMASLVQGYTSNGQYEMSTPTYFGTAAGLVSTVVDLCRFSIALDNDLLLLPESKERMFTPAISNSGQELPYGLGWFIDNNEGVKIIWHYGYWDAVSSLIVKIPERELAFVVLANSDRLSSASPGIGSDEDVNRSVAAQEFLNAFIYGTAALPDDPVR